MHLTILFDKPGNSHSELLKCHHVNAEEKVWLDLFLSHPGVNERSDEERELDHTNEKYGRAKLESRAESKLPHFEEILSTRVFRWHISLSWNE